MSIYDTDLRGPVIYQADPSAAQHYHNVRNSMHQNLSPHLNQKVKVQTHDGFTHVGVLAGMDGKFMYLSVTVNGDPVRGFYNPYYKPYPPGYPHPAPGSVILPLVLFELLAISLL